MSAVLCGHVAFPADAGIWLLGTGLLVARQRPLRRRLDQLPLGPLAANRQLPGARRRNTSPRPDPTGPSRWLPSRPSARACRRARRLLHLRSALDRNSNALSPELADRCRQVIGDALAYYRDRCGLKWDLPFHHVNHYGWQDLSQRAFTLAGEVSSKAAK